MKVRAVLAASACMLAMSACNSSPTFEGTVFVAETNSKDVAMIDGTSLTILTRIPLPGKPHGVDIEPGGKRVWASNIEGDTVSVIDIATRRVVSSIKVCAGPVNVAFAVSRAFVACGDGYMTVIDTATLTVLKAEAIGFAPHEIMVGPHGRLWSVNRGSNDVSEIDPATGKLVSRHPAGPFAYDAVFSPDGTYAFVTSKTWGAVTVLSTDDFQILGSIKVGAEPAGLVMAPDGKRIYVSNKKDGTVSVINAQTFQVLSAIRVGAEPGGIAVSPDGRLLFVANFASNTLSVIDTDEERVIKSISVGEAPDDVVILPKA